MLLSALALAAAAAAIPHAAALATPPASNRQQQPDSSSSTTTNSSKSLESRQWAGAPCDRPGTFACFGQQTVCVCNSLNQWEESTTCRDACCVEQGPSVYCTC